MLCITFGVTYVYSITSSLRFLLHMPGLAVSIAATYLDFWSER
jgi:hypothetical protein